MDANQVLSQGNTTTYTWQSMWSQHTCSCCSYGLLRHLSARGIYWRCSHCYQEMPAWDIFKTIDTLAVGLNRDLYLIERT
ncbi:MAG: hypothetical protein H0X31_14225 [Nostocaceae cyanobacterium]|nr:hypothetical protein [Nostocaceae cyanobacterium]